MNKLLEAVAKRFDIPHKECDGCHGTGGCRQDGAEIICFACERRRGDTLAALAPLDAMVEACGVKRTGNESDTFRYATRVADAYRAACKELGVSDE